jgi:hypothetical protein
MTIRLSAIVLLSILFLGSLFSGCGGFSTKTAGALSTTTPIPLESWSEKTFASEIQLTLTHSVDPNTGITLVSIANDLTTKIRLKNGELLSVKPNDFLLCEQFGTSGLQLISVSPKNGTAVLRHMWSEESKGVDR